MEDRAVVPDVAGDMVGFGGDVGDLPANEVGAFAEMGASSIECGLGDVQHSDGVATVDKAFRENGTATANIENVSRGADLGDELERQRWLRLCPTEAVVLFCLVNRFPVFFRVHVDEPSVSSTTEILRR